MDIFDNITEWHRRDADGCVLPWYTPELLTRLQARPDLDRLTVFEYGIGLSTLWYARRCMHVTGAEIRPDWLESVAGELRIGGRSNFHLKLVDEHSLGAYLAAPWIHAPYDILAIDGAFRVECMEYCMRYLAPGGWMIVDNSERFYSKPIWQKLMTENRGENFEHAAHYGNPKWATSLFLKPGEQRGGCGSSAPPPAP